MNFEHRSKLILATTYVNHIRHRGKRKYAEAYLQFMSGKGVPLNPVDCKIVDKTARQTEVVINKILGLEPTGELDV
jgi:hypothetical protein